MTSPSSSSSGLSGDQEAQAIAYFEGFFVDLPRCSCGLIAHELTYDKGENAGMRVNLYGTVKDEKVSACEFEDWVDPSFPWWATQVINELTEANKDMKEELLGISNTKDVEIANLKEKYAHAEGISKYLYSQLDIKEQGEREATDAREEMLKKRLMLQKGISILSAILILFAAGMMLLLKSI